MKKEEKPLFSSEAVYQSLTHFSDQLSAAPTLEDGVLTARVIGEFSAGKTRLLRELFKDNLPEALFPISSLERQTRLQLEITYGETPSLHLIERPADHNTAIFRQELTHFPNREDLKDQNPERHRLRLALNEPRLILTEGDGYTEEKTPKRLFLIDTPGWNSGDDAFAEKEAHEIMTGFHNLALVYVSNASRLDGQINAERLNAFLEAMGDADFLGQYQLIFVITHCPPEDQARFKQKIEARVRKMWEDLYLNPEQLSLEVIAVDFEVLSPAELVQFREDFWTALRAPLNQAVAEPIASEVQTLRQWPESYSLSPFFHATKMGLEEAKTRLAQAMVEGEFFPGMNKHRLMGLNATERTARLTELWSRQLGASLSEMGDRLMLKWPVDPKHPLSDWIETYWLTRYLDTLAPTFAFFEEVKRCFESMPADVEDVEFFLQSRLKTLYLEAQYALEGSFSIVLEQALAAWALPHAENRVATLLSLSLLETHYHVAYLEAA